MRVVAITNLFGFPPGRLIANYNGVDCMRFEPIDRHAARQSLGLPAESKWPLFVDNPNVAKGSTDLMRAFDILAAHDPRPMLAFVGDGEARPQRAGEAWLGGRVRMPGKCSRAAMLAWFRAARLHALLGESGQ